MNNELIRILKRVRSHSRSRSDGACCDAVTAPPQLPGGIDTGFAVPENKH